jgi:hypothetical protein
VLIQKEALAISPRMTLCKQRVYHKSGKKVQVDAP